MNNINPAWQGILGTLPESLHKLVIPELEKWDKGIQDKFQEIHNEYEPLKPFKQFIDNNIDPNFAWQSVVFADELQKNPSGIVEQINENWNLGYVPKTELEKAVAEASANPPEAGDGSDDDLFGDGKVDLTKVPEFVAMKQALDAMQSSSEEERRKQSEQEELEAFEADLAALEAKAKEDSKPFNKMFVTALMAQGVSGDDALDQYALVLGQTVTPGETQTTSTSTDAPITMGNQGTVGGGTDDGAVDWNSMGTSDFNDNVAKVLEAMQNGSTT